MRGHSLEHTDSDDIRTDVLSTGFVVAGRYEIQHLLGTGGMGSVYLAHDRILGAEKIAIKILHRQFAFEQKYTQRFLREIQLMRRVNHRNVVRTYDVGADGDIVYFTMEYVHGQSLLDLIESRSFPKEQLVNIVTQICDGLSAIHESGIIHRDLKPGNLIVLEDYTVKITDFGVARPESSELTAHNEVIGSSPYIAPEVWLGDKVTSAVDLYSLGIILYELSTGVLPFDGESPAVLMRMHLDRAPVPPREINKSIPSWLNKLVLKLLEKSPLARPRTAADVIQYVKDNTSARALDLGPDNVGSYAPVSTSNTFLDKLEELSKKATDAMPTVRGGKRDSANLARKMLQKIPTGNHGISRVTDHVIWTRLFEWFGGFFGKIVSFAGKRVFALGMLGLLGAILVWGTSNIITQLPALDSPPSPISIRHQGYSINLYSWGHVVKSGIPYVLLFLFLVSAPMMLISAWCGSLAAALRGFLLGLAFNVIAGGIIFLNHFIPAFSDKRLSPQSLIHAAMATGRQLAELSLLSPIVTLHKSEQLPHVVLISPERYVPLTHSVMMALLVLIYLVLIVYTARRALDSETKKPELVYLPLVVGCLALLLIEERVMPEMIDYVSAARMTFEVLQFKLEPAKVFVVGTLINWGFIYFTVGFFVPLTGGKRTDD